MTHSIPDDCDQVASVTENQTASRPKDAWAIMVTDCYEFGGWLVGIFCGDSALVERHLKSLAAAYAATLNGDHWPRKDISAECISDTEIVIELDLGETSGRTWTANLFSIERLEDA